MPQPASAFCSTCPIFGTAGLWPRQTSTRPAYTVVPPNLKENTINRHLLAALLALTSGAASAEIVTVRYEFFDDAAYSYRYGWFGSDLGPTEGTILGAKLVLKDYRVPAGLDAAHFHFDFA
ncbi:hypothetical protein, partial [Tahibacter harae]